MNAEKKKILEDFFGTKFQDWESSGAGLMSLPFRVKNCECQLLVDNKNDIAKLEIDSKDDPNPSFPIVEVSCHFNIVDTTQTGEGWPILKFYHADRTKDVAFLWITKFDGHLSFSVFPNAET